MTERDLAALEREIKEIVSDVEAGLLTPWDAVDQLVALWHRYE